MLQVVVSVLMSISYGRIMWMHNGGIAQFDKVMLSHIHTYIQTSIHPFSLQIKRKLLGALPEELFLFVQGNTDSEWAFALFLSFVSAS